MKPETIYEALVHAPDDYLDSAQIAMERGKRRMGIRRAWLLAACITLSVAMVAVPIASYVIRANDPLYDLPVMKIDHEMLEGVFSNAISMDEGNSSATSNYESIRVSDPQYLYLNTPPQTQYIPLYSVHRKSYALNQDEFSAFAKPRIDRLLTAMNVRKGNVSESEHEYSSELSMSVEGYLGSSPYPRVQINANQTQNSHEIYLFPCYTVKLEGETILLDQSKSDEEIAQSMDSIRKKFNAIFDEDFTEVSVKRWQSSIFNQATQQNDPGIFYSIEFHNRNELPLTEGRLWQREETDYIRISFEITSYRAGATAPLYAIRSIVYHKSRIPLEETYQLEGKAEMLSLQKAEELLNQGVCFANNVRCPFCHPDPLPPKNFTDYDHVGFSYRFSTDFNNEKANESIVIPFYVFYKYRETDENGLLIYDYTYVPAVEFEGIEEYFTG